MTNKIEISKRYIHNNKIYEVVNFCSLNNLLNAPVDGVIYKEMADNTLHVIRREVFNNKFTPCNLFVNDTVVAYSMGKLICTYDVIEVKDGMAYFNYKNSGERSELVTRDNINSIGGIDVLKPDPKNKHINCLEYYLETPQLKKMICNKEYVGKIKSELMNISEEIDKIDVSFIQSEVLLNILNHLKKYSKETTNQIRIWQPYKIQ